MSTEEHRRAASDVRQRTELVGLRLTPDEHAAAESRAAEAGITVQELIRHLLAAPTSPSEPVPSTPRVPGSTESPEGISAVREEWRVTGSTNGPYVIDDGPWERIYPDREAAVRHFGVVGRADPTCALTFDRRTVTTYTTPWEPEEVEETTGGQ